jgi:hypothetical protein
MSFRVLSGQQLLTPPMNGFAVISNVWHSLLKVFVWPPLGSFAADFRVHPLSMRRFSHSPPSPANATPQKILHHQVSSILANKI